MLLVCLHILWIYLHLYVFNIRVVASGNKGEIQRERLFRCKGEIDEANKILRQAKNLEDQPEDFWEPKQRLSKDKESLQSQSPEFYKRHGNVRVTTGINNVLALYVVGQMIATVL